MTFTEEELRLAEPQAIEESTLEAWYMDDSDEDQRLPHKKTPNEPCPLSALRALGVLSWKMTGAPDAWEGDAKLAAIRKVRGYSYVEIVNIRRDTLPDYDAKIAMFYQEHLHADEEIRYVLDGRGYFDVRDLQDRWIRISCCPGDLIVLPEGIYHRFTLDTGDYVKAMRLFVGEPVWTPINRGAEADATPAREAYTKTFVLGKAVEAA